MARTDIELENLLDPLADKDGRSSPNVGADADGQQAVDFEHDMTFRDAVRLYPKALFFSLGISLAIIMEGYDMALMGNFYSVPQFRQQYGTKLENGDYQLTSGWQSALSAISSVGAIFGLILAGHLIEKFGFRHSMFIGLGLMAVSIYIVYSARSVEMLFLGELCCGAPWGMFQGMASTYAADVAPLALRSLLTSYISLCWSLGQFFCVGVLRACLDRSDEWAYRIPFAVQWIWLPPIACVVFFAPESPWWLLRKGRRDDARQALRDLASPAVSDQEINGALRLMHVTNKQEKSVQEGTTYRDMFDGINLRRTEITAVAWVCQVLSGTWFSSNITYFMEQAGQDQSIAFNFGLGMTGLGCLGVIACFFITPYVGRRQMYLWGLIGMGFALALVGILALPDEASATRSWASGGLLIWNNILYHITLGPVCFTIVTEIPSVRLRNRTIAFGRSCYLAFAIAANFLQTAMLNPTAWDLKGKGAFIWCLTCAAATLWTYYRLPETRGRLPAEVNILFNNNVPARRFEKARVNIFSSQVTS